MYKIESPIGINVMLEPYCEDCNMSDLSIGEELLWRIGGKDIYRRQITCSKYSLCKQIYEHLGQFKNETEEREDDENN